MSMCAMRLVLLMLLVLPYKEHSRNSVLWVGVAMQEGRGGVGIEQKQKRHTREPY